MKKVILALVVFFGLVGVGMAGNNNQVSSFDQQVSPRDIQGAREVVGGSDRGDGANRNGNNVGFTTPVPEPGEWALMLSGLGLVGAVIRRRTKGRAD
jgi:hypothetical protein